MTDDLAERVRRMEIELARLRAYLEELERRDAANGSTARAANPAPGGG